jgi:hypothetical protein
MRLRPKAYELYKVAINNTAKQLEASDEMVNDVTITHNLIKAANRERVKADEAEDGIKTSRRGLRGAREQKRSTNNGSVLHFPNYTFVAWKTRKHLTRVQSLLSEVIDLECFLPLATIVGFDDGKEEYPESHESDEVR